MEIEKQIEKDAMSNLWFHAYLFVGGNKEKIEETINFVIKSKNILKEDISEVCSVDEDGNIEEIKVEAVKKLISQISLTPLGKERLVIIRNCEKLNRNSANILLKSIEEPVGKTTFLLISKTSSLLPTIKSRCRVYYFPNYPVPNINSEAEEFLKGDFIVASRAIETIIKKGEYDSFFENALFHLRKVMLDTKSQKAVDIIQFTEKIRNDINNNASVKLALECLWFKAREIYG